MSNSTTKYRNYTNAELLSLFEARLGASPIIDELWTRLQAAEDAEDYVKEVESSKESLLKDVDSAIDQAQEVFNRNMALVKDLICHCPVCEAPNSIVVPEFEDIEDCLELKNH